MSQPRQRTPASLPSDRRLGCLFGGLLGLLLTNCLAIGVLVLSGDQAQVAPCQPPATYAVEVVIHEDYINRVLVESAIGLLQSVPLRAGHLDIRDGSRGDFAVQTDLGPFHLVLRGTVRVRVTESGELSLALDALRIGRLPITPFVPARLLDGVSEDLNRLLEQSAHAVNVHLVGVTSDETTLHVYLDVEDSDPVP